VRIAAFADVQGNPWAARAILDALKRVEDVEVYALGNVVGRGPRPAETVEILRKARVHLVAGPRDVAAVGKPPREEYRAEGEANGARLTPPQATYLRAGAPPRRVVMGGMALLLTADPSPQVGASKVVLFPGDEARIEDRDRVTHACVGRADDPSGEAPFVLYDADTGLAQVRRAAWDVDMLARAR
jgi:hypothetical protein